MKRLTREQAQARKDAAVRFVDNALGDSAWASEIEDEDLEDWAARKNIQLINPRTRNVIMPNGNGGNGRTKQDLLDEVDELQQENEDLRDQLSAIADIAAPPDEEDEEDADDQ